MFLSEIVLLTGCLVSSLYDLRFHLIPDLVLLFTGAEVVAVKIFLEGSFTVWNLAGAFGMLLIFIVVLFFTGGIGGGDIKLIFVIALGKGFFDCAKICGFGAGTGIVFALAWKALGKKIVRIPMAPFLTAGFLFNLCS